MKGAVTAAALEGWQPPNRHPGRRPSTRVLCSRCSDTTGALPIGAALVPLGNGDSVPV